MSVNFCGSKKSGPEIHQNITPESTALKKIINRLNPKEHFNDFFRCGYIRIQYFLRTK